MVGHVFTAPERLLIDELGQPVDTEVAAGNEEVGNEGLAREALADDPDRALDGDRRDPPEIWICLEARERRSQLIRIAARLAVFLRELPPAAHPFATLLLGRFHTLGRSPFAPGLSVLRKSQVHSQADLEHDWGIAEIGQLQRDRAFEAGLDQRRGGDHEAEAPPGGTAERLRADAGGQLNVLKAASDDELARLQVERFAQTPADVGLATAQRIAEGMCIDRVKRGCSGGAPGDDDVRAEPDVYARLTDLAIGIDDWRDHDAVRARERLCEFFAADHRCTLSSSSSFPRRMCL